MKKATPLAIFIVGAIFLVVAALTAFGTVPNIGLASLSLAIGCAILAYGYTLRRRSQ